MGGGWTGPAGLVAAGALLVLGLLAARVALVPDPPGRLAWPSAEEMAALDPYLEPAGSEVLETAGVPESVVVRGDPFGGQAVWTGSPGGGGVWGADPGGGGESSPRWTLSAVLIAGERRIAIVNDRMVRPGDRLEDGERVEAIGSDYIVIITPDGERRRLELERQEP